MKNSSDANAVINDLSPGARCWTCKHWTIPVEESGWGNAVFGKCGAVPHSQDVADEARQIDDWDEREAAEAAAYAAKKAMAVDGSGYYAALVTQADFGCVLHEPTDGPMKGHDPAPAKSLGSQNPLLNPAGSGGKDFD